MKSGAFAAALAGSIGQYDDLPSAEQLSLEQKIVRAWNEVNDHNGIIVCAGQQDARSAWDRLTDLLETLRERDEAQETLMGVRSR